MPRTQHLQKTLLALAVAGASHTAWATPSCPQALGDTSANVTLNTNCDLVTVASSVTIYNPNNLQDTITSNALIGKFINHGYITANGSISSTFNVSGGSIGIFENHGTIRSAGGFGTTINLSGGSIETLLNYGSITAVSGISNAISLSGGSIQSINNYGSISAVSGYAILNNTSSSALVVNHYDGSISGSDAAISGTGSTTLNWFGGTLSGNLSNLKEFNVSKANANFSGTLSTQANGIIRLQLSNDNSTPLLTNDSLINLGDSTRVLLKPKGSDFAANNTSYTLLKAGEGSINAPNLQVLSESVLLRVNSFALLGDQVTANVSAASQYQFGGSPNGQRAGSALLPQLSKLASSNPNDPILNALAGNAEQVRKTSDELAPQVSGNVFAPQQQAQQMQQQTNGRLRGANSGDLLAEQGLWMKALHSKADQDMRQQVAGFDAESNGMALGFDGKLNEQLTVGLAYSYLHSNVSGDSNSTEIDGHAITAYGGFAQDGYFVNGSLTAGLQHNDGQRYIAGTKAEADYDSQSIALDVVGGYGFDLDNGLLLEPRIGARYGRVDTDSYREKGSLASLKVEEQRFEIGQLGAGARIAGALELGSGILQPEATAMVYHDFIADSVSTTSTFVAGGSPFLSVGATPARTSYEVGVGASYALGNTTFGVSYDYLGREDFDANTVEASVRYDF